MGKALKPKPTGSFVHRYSRNVSIDFNGVGRVSVEMYINILKSRFSPATWKEQCLNPKVADEFAIKWIFLVDSLNFSFWPDPGQEYAVTYKFVEYTGYWSLCAVINRALDQGIPMCNPEYYSDLSFDQFKRIFRANKPGKPEEPAEMPMLQERYDIMRQVGKVLVKKFSGNPVALIVKAGHKARTLLKYILRYFPSFKDECKYKGQKVSFHKRAQILIADIYACYEGKGLGRFDDIDNLSMFADYRVPQTLYFYKVLKYRKDLVEQLRDGKVFNYGDQEEVEIRGVSIEAVDRIATRIYRLIEYNRILIPMKINSAMVDFYLWNMRREKAEEIDQALPFHKCRSIYY